jgi:hypothetical protein
MRFTENLSSNFEDFVTESFFLTAVDAESLAETRRVIGRFQRDSNGLNLLATIQNIVPRRSSIQSYIVNRKPKIYYRSSILAHSYFFRFFQSFLW